MVTACELCAQGIPDSYGPPDPVRFMSERPGQVSICEPHLRIMEKLGFRFGHLSSPSRPNRRTRRAAKARNLTRAQRKAAG